MDGRGPGAGVRLTGPGAPVVGRAVSRGGEVGAGAAEAAAGTTGALVGAGVLGAGVLGTGVPGRADEPALGVIRVGPGLGTVGRRVSGPRLGLGAGRPLSLPAAGVASFSFSRRSTGGSTVEDAERTNSPMSFNIVRTVLLSTPSSFASS